MGSSRAKRLESPARWIFRHPRIDSPLSISSLLPQHRSRSHNRISRIFRASTRIPHPTARTLKTPSAGDPLTTLRRRSLFRPCCRNRRLHQRSIGEGYAADPLRSPMCMPDAPDVPTEYFQRALAITGNFSPSRTAPELLRGHDRAGEIFRGWWGRIACRATAGGGNGRDSDRQFSEFR